MSPHPRERWRHVDALLDAALELEAAEREVFLDRACKGDAELCTEVRCLLQSCDAAGSFLEESVAPIAARLIAGPRGAAETLQGARIGPYRVVESIGHGGMGAVYLAERDDEQYHKRVALKLLPWSTRHGDAARRFRAERQILASLEHPAIARLLDGGMTPDGVPYFAMEYVEGIPIDRYCDDRRLPLQARLELFCLVCGAVQYAHRNLVVHRDLKPSNILVTDQGEVKLLDFGIAKLLDSELAGAAGPHTRIQPMTPGFASPEQIRGEPITTATDIYSLGILLYLLLTHRHPYALAERSPHDVERAILEQEPERPSVTVMRPEPSQRAWSPERASRRRAKSPEKLRRQLRGDLDTIVLTALRKEPSRRYATVDQLASDVRRHLAGLPVSARPDTWVYRTHKFLGRNRTGAAAAALFLVLMIAFSLAMRTQAARTARERDVALREADKAARVSAFMSEMFFLADPGQSRGENVTVREALDSGRAWIGRELTSHPELSVEMGRQLGEVYYRLGRYQEAREVWESARAVGIAHGGEFQEPVLGVTLVLVKALEDLGRSDSAEVLARRALVIQQQLPALRDDAFTTTHILLRLGRVLRHQGRLEEAETVLRRALAILPETHRDARHRRTVLVTALSHVRRAAGDPVGAEGLLRGILETRRATFGEEHPEVAQVLMNLGLALADQGRYAEAETLARQGLEMYRRVLSEGHPDVALGVESLAYVLHRKGDVAAAAELYRRALELQRRNLPPDHPRRGAALFGLGRALLDQGRGREAEPLLREALQLRRGVTGDGSPGVAEIQAALEAARAPRPNP